MQALRSSLRLSRLQSARLSGEQLFRAFSASLQSIWPSCRCQPAQSMTASHSACRILHLKHILLQEASISNPLKHLKHATEALWQIQSPFNAAAYYMSTVHTGRLVHQLMELQFRPLCQLPANHESFCRVSTLTPDCHESSCQASQECPQCVSCLHLLSVFMVNELCQT